MGPAATAALSDGSVRNREGGLGLLLRQVLLGFGPGIFRNRASPVNRGTHGVAKSYEKISPAMVMPSGATSILGVGPPLCRGAEIFIYKISPRLHRSYLVATRAITKTQSGWTITLWVQFVS